MLWTRRSGAILGVILLLASALVMADPQSIGTTQVSAVTDLTAQLTLKVRDSMDIHHGTALARIQATNQVTGISYEFKADESGLTTIQLPAATVKDARGAEQFALYTLTVNAPSYKTLVMRDIPARFDTEQEVICPMFKGTGIQPLNHPKQKAVPGVKYAKIDPTPEAYTGPVGPNIVPSATVSEMVEPTVVYCRDKFDGPTYTLATSEWLAKVVTNEWAGITPINVWEAEALKAGVVASRSWMYYNTIIKPKRPGKYLVNDGSDITWAPTATAAAINAVSAVGKRYLSDGSTWDDNGVTRYKAAEARFSAIVTNRENRGMSASVQGHPYLKSIYDEADYTFDLTSWYLGMSLPQPGLSQHGSNFWAHGFWNSDDNYEPPMMYGWILAHYYTNIQLRMAN